jgi:tetratricopeptide (TPR) repeat protein
MAANNHNNDTQENSNGQAVESHEPVDFFESEIARYSAALEADPEDTYRRYGFTLYHSLPPGQLVLESQKLGFFRGDAADQYNLAGLELEKNNLEGAKELLEKSIEMDDTIPEAAYNLALVYEKLDRKADAIKMWNRFLELADEDEELAPVEAHLAELQA